MARNIYIDHNFTNEQHNQLVELGYDIYTPPDWLNPLNFFVRGTVAEPHYINSQYQEAVDDRRMFITTDHRVVGHIADLQLNDSEDANHRGVLIIGEDIFRSVTGEDIDEMLKEAFPVEFFGGKIVHIDHKGVTEVTDMTYTEAKEFVRDKDDEQLEAYMQSTQGAEYDTEEVEQEESIQDQNTPEQIDPIDHVIEEELDMDQPQAEQEEQSI